MEAAREGGPPLVIVGGTGLYFKALLEGLSPVPDIPDEIRRHWRAEAAARDSAELHAVLPQRDPAMAARLRPCDPQRIVRALEVIEATGRSLLDWQEVRRGPARAKARRKALCCAAPRGDLCPLRRAAGRDDGGGRAGGGRGVGGARSRPALPAMRAHGVPAISGASAGSAALDAALAAAKTETRHYAKRQLTWARRNMMSWKAYLYAINGKNAAQKRTF